MNMLNILLLILVSCGYITAETCSVFCEDAPNNGIVCDAVTYECLYGCKPGYAGTHCTIQCCGACKTCVASATDPTSVVCGECNDEFYLESGQCYPCSRTCARNSSSTLPVCKPVNGSCEFGCEQGLYGAMCEHICSRTCMNGECDPVDGSCTAGCILPVLTGPTCQNACNAGCKRRECDQSGFCTSGGCQPEYWGAACSEKCSENCVTPTNIGYPLCDQQNGTCLHGCVNNTFWRNDCSKACSATCAEKKCDFDNGHCLGGCIDDYEGPMCAEKQTSENKKTIIIASAVGGGVFIIILIIVICCCVKKCRQ